MTKSDNVTERNNAPLTECPHRVGPNIACKSAVPVGAGQLQKCKPAKTPTIGDGAKKNTEKHTTSKKKAHNDKIKAAFSTCTKIKFSHLDVAQKSHFIYNLTFSELEPVRRSSTGLGPVPVLDRS